MTRGSSRMADLAAAMRAAHTLQDRPLVFEDRPAIDLISMPWRRVCRSRWLSRLVLRRVFGDVYRPVQCQILARSRFAEDKLEEEVREKRVDQYVIVSAGLDSFCVRQPEFASALRIYEIDHPLTQGEKKRRLARARYSVPANVEFLPVDLEVQSVGGALRQSPTFSFERPAVLSWLGATAYLTMEAVRRTLRSVRESLAPGTLIVFDYILPEEALGEPDRRRQRFLHGYAARRGEPPFGRIDPDTLLRDSEAIGLRVDEHVTTAGFRERYFTGRPDDLIPTGGSNLIALRLP